VKTESFMGKISPIDVEKGSENLDITQQLK